MKSKPVVMEFYHTSHTSFVVDFSFENNITLLLGNSGTGKTAAFSFIRESMADDDRIMCLNFIDANKNIDELIQKAEKKLIVIDNADVLLSDETRKYIAFDKNNQYMIIGRNPANLMATEDNLFELASESKGEKTRFFLRHYI